jgi:hypothetical protein
MTSFGISGVECSGSATGELALQSCSNTYISFISGHLMQQGCRLPKLEYLRVYGPKGQRDVGRQRIRWQDVFKNSEHQNDLVAVRP